MTISIIIVVVTTFFITIVSSLSPMIQVEATSNTFNHSTFNTSSPSIISKSNENPCQSHLLMNIPVPNTNLKNIEYYKTLIIQYRHEYQTKGYVHIPNFLTTQLLNEMKNEALSFFSPNNTTTNSTNPTFYSNITHTIYQEPFDFIHYPANHLRNIEQQSSKTIVDYDRLDKQTSPLRKLYNCPMFKDFIQDIVMSTTSSSCSSMHHDDNNKDLEIDSDGVCRNNILYYSDCPYNAAYYNMYTTGDGLGWHFDKGDFGINLVLQESDEGGEFELHHNTRTTNDPWSFCTVQSVLQLNQPKQQETYKNLSPLEINSTISNKEDITTENHPLLLDCSNDDSDTKDITNDMYKINPQSGSLVLFSGANNLHRVTPVTGAIPRINAIVHFEQEPGKKLGSYSLQKFFGR